MVAQKWKKIQEAKTDKERVHFVTTQDELSHVQPKNVDYLMGYSSNDLLLA